MLAGSLVIVLFSIFKMAVPRRWAGLEPAVKPQQRPLTPAEEQQIKRLQDRLTVKVLGQADQAAADKAPANQKLQPVVPVAPQPPARQGALPPDLQFPKALFANINENALYIRHAEGRAYWTVLAKLRDVPQSELEQAAAQDITYTQLFAAPDTYRGRLVTLEGELLQLKRLPPHENDAKIDVVYEGWLKNADSGKNPYVFHCLDKPPGLREGEKLSERVAITGYFFKRYQYAAKSGLTYAAPMLLVKRIRWFPVVQRKAAADPRWVPYLLGGIAVVGISLGATICVFILREQRRSKAQLKRFAAPPITDFGPIEP